MGSSPFTDDADEPGVAEEVCLGLGSRASGAAAVVVLAVLAAVGAGDGVVEGGSVDELTVAGVAVAEAVGAVEGGDAILGMCVVVDKKRES